MPSLPSVRFRVRASGGGNVGGGGERRRAEACTGLVGGDVPGAFADQRVGGTAGRVGVLGHPVRPMSLIAFSFDWVPEGGQAMGSPSG